MKPIKKVIPFGNQEIIIETGEVAKQASSVLVYMGDSVVLVTVVGTNNPLDVKDFVPLRVDYQERYYAAGKIPGGFFKREGRPTERETLICRLIDRPIRPLFPEGFGNEVQIVATVLSIDPNVDTDIPALMGASAALSISGIPFDGPIGAARVGYIDGQFVLNPNKAEADVSLLDLVVAGTSTSVLMVESEAQELSESVMLEAVVFGQKGFRPVIKAIEELAKEVGTPAWDWSAPVKNEDLEKEIRQFVEKDIEAAYLIQDKLARRQKIKDINKSAYEKFLTDSEDKKRHADIHNIMEEIDRDVVRGRILKNEPRIDGRDTKTVRPISIKTSFLPRTHGSVLFTRGETQAIVVLTLGTSRDSQLIDGPLGEYKDTFMLHYNFPPYSVGEVGQVGSPKRREIGHGMLAKRAMRAVLPNDSNFPYVLRIVSEITESNGSSSMATVCGASLALMDAGVPTKAAVAGIAMGLIKEGDKFQVLTDILGDEDHLGDMDFKVAGTSQGVTALQMDIKINGITEEIMQVALEQAKAGRLHILNIMNQAIAQPKTEMSSFAPQIISFRIHPDKIRDVIGKGGATIRSLTEDMNATVDIQDDGTVQIAAVDRAAGDEVRRRIDLITADAEVGQIYQGKVVRLAEFGAFVNFLPGKDGLVHISQISEQRIENVGDVLQEGQVVTVKVLEIDRQGRIRLSMRDIMVDTGGAGY